MLAIADLLPVMIAYFDTRLRYRFINKPLAEWLERPRERDPRADHGRDHRRRGVRREREAMIEAALARRAAVLRRRVRPSDARAVAIQSDYVPWATRDGEVRRDRHRWSPTSPSSASPKSALRESEARFRRIANSAPAMMWVTRLDRVRDFVNDAYVEFVCGPGCDPEEARTLDWRTRIHPEDVERIVAESIAGEASGRRFTLEGRYLRHDGE